jgi:hypothetical protein
VASFVEEPSIRRGERAILAITRRLDRHAVTSASGARRTAIQRLAAIASCLSAFPPIAARRLSGDPLRGSI